MTDFKGKQYKKVLTANKRRNEIPTMDWTPIEEEENPEEFMECVYKKELGSSFEKVDSGVGVGLVDFTQDSEYKRLLKIQARARGEKK